MTVALSRSVWHESVVGTAANDDASWKTRPDVRRHTHLVCFVSCIWLWFVVGFGPPRLVDREFAPTVRLDTSELRSLAESAQPPDLTATAYLLYDVDADQVLFAQNAEQTLPPASLTKLMTALLVLEQDTLNARVTVDVTDLIGGATMGLRAGETLTVEQLLRGLLIPSGNDAARTLARHSAGSVEAFVAQMNARTAELDMTQTQFANPHGLDAAEHVSSAADLLTLTRQLWTFPLFRDIVGTRSAEVAGHALRNTNELLGAFPGADGIKTGTTPAAGENLIASITRDGHTVFLLILGSTDRYGDARTLYETYSTRYAWTHGRIDRLMALNRVYGRTGRLWYVRAEGEPPQLLQPRWTGPDLRAFRQIQLPPGGQPWQPGMYAGVVEWRLGDIPIGNQMLVLW